MAVGTAMQADIAAQPGINQSGVAAGAELQNKAHDFIYAPFAIELALPSRPRMVRKSGFPAFR